jgi:hypothetical protein
LIFCFADATAQKEDGERKTLAPSTARASPASATPTPAPAAAAAAAAAPVAPHSLHKHNDARRIPRSEWVLSGTVPQAIYNDNRYYLTTELDLQHNTGVAPAADFHRASALRRAWAPLEAADDELIAAAAAKRSASASSSPVFAVATASDVKSLSVSVPSASSSSSSAASASTANSNCSYVSDIRDSDSLPLFVRDPQTAVHTGHQVSAILLEAERKAKAASALALAAAAAASVVQGPTDALVPCPNGCGASVARALLTLHLHKDCAHTLVPCKSCARPHRRRDGKRQPPLCFGLCRVVLCVPLCSCFVVHFA